MEIPKLDGIIDVNNPDGIITDILDAHCRPPEFLTVICDTSFKSAGRRFLNEVFLLQMKNSGDLQCVF